MKMMPTLDIRETTKEITPILFDGRLGVSTPEAEYWKRRYEEREIEWEKRFEGREAKWNQKFEEREAEWTRKYEEQKQELIRYKHEANYWKAEFEQLKKRYEKLEKEVEELKIQLKKREEQLFGRKSERMGRSGGEREKKNEEPARKRGQQVGEKGHGRRTQETLPIKEEVVELANACCPCCKLPYKSLTETEDSNVMEIETEVYCRRIKRKKYKRVCTCSENRDSQIVTAPAVGKLLAKSQLGVTIWTKILLSKYQHQQPVHRVLEELTTKGLSIAVGTVMEGLQKLPELLMPLYDAIVEKSLREKHWHADETGWKVFEKIEEKKNENWYLWIFKGKEAVVFKIAPSRGAKVLTEHFGEKPTGGILSVDRYGAYKAVAKKGLFILAYCWAHVRRDFLELSKACVSEEAWGLGWVERIGKLYHANNERLLYRETSKSYRTCQKALEKRVEEMRKQLDEELKDKQTGMLRKKTLTSLNNHWEGLTVFIKNPTVPMDNNPAERGLRPSVIGRKNYYGSRAIWSAELSAIMFTLLETLKLYEMNPHTWLLTYLQACATEGGKVLENIDCFLPWKMTEEEKQRFSQPPSSSSPNRLVDSS